MVASAGKGRTLVSVLPAARNHEILRPAQTAALRMTLSFYQPASITHPRFATARVRIDVRRLHDLGAQLAEQLSGSKQNLTSFRIENHSSGADRVTSICEIFHLPICRIGSEDRQISICTGLNATFLS